MVNFTVEDAKNAFPGEPWVDEITQADIENYLAQAKEWKEQNKLNENLYDLYYTEKPNFKGYLIIFNALDCDDCEEYWKYLEHKNKERMISNFLKRCILLKRLNNFQACSTCKRTLLNSLRDPSEIAFAKDLIQKLDL